MGASLTDQHWLDRVIPSGALLRICVSPNGSYTYVHHSHAKQGVASSFVVFYTCFKDCYASRASDGSKLLPNASKMLLKYVVWVLALGPVFLQCFRLSLLSVDTRMWETGLRVAHWLPQKAS